MKSKLLWIVGLFLLPLVSVISQSWTSLNGPSRVSTGKDIAVGYASSNRILYLADYGTALKKSTDAGASWSSTTTAISNPIATICKPDDANRLIVAIDGVIKASTDGGTSFYFTNNITNLLPLRFGISGVNSNQVFLGTLYPQQGTVHATLYQSTDGGETWTPDNFFFNNNLRTNIHGIAWHPTDEDQVWVAGSRVRVVSGTEAPPAPGLYYDDELFEDRDLKRGVWHSTDAGENWNAVAEQDIDDASISAIGVSVNGGTTTVFAGTADDGNKKGEVWKSTDGASWTKILDFGGGSITFITVMPSGSSSRIYVGHNIYGIAYSFNNGANWYYDNSSTAHESMFDPDVRGIAVNSTHPNDVFAVSQSSVFFGSRSSAGLIDWQDKNTGLTKVATTSVSASSSSVLAVGPTFTGIARYTSAGGWRTWYAAPTKTDMPFIEFNTVAFDPSNANKTIAGGRQKVSPNSSSFEALTFYNGANGAGNWSEEFRSDNSASDYTINSFTADPDHSSLRYALGRMKQGSTTSNLLVSADNGESWNIQSGIGGVSDPAICMAIDPTGSSSEIFYASVSAKGIYKTTNAGNSWSQLSLGNGYTVRSIVLNGTSPSTIYAGGDVTSGYGLWKSENSGSSWTNLRSDACPRVLMHPSYPSSVNHVWAITDGGTKVRKTVDGGSNWTEISTSGFTTPLSDLRRDEAVDSVIYLATAAGIYKINPAPEKTVGLSVSGSYLQNPTIDWTDNAESDLAGYKLYRTGCDNWSYQLVAVIGSDSSIYTDPGVVVGNGSGDRRYYIVAFDNQNNHATASDVLIVDCSAVDWRNSYNPVETEELPREFSLRENFPNPFNPVTTIRYTLPVDADVNLTVVDVLGRQVSVLVNERQTAGYKSLEFNASNLASGVYLYKLTAGTFSDIKKMIVTK